MILPLWKWFLKLPQLCLLETRTEPPLVRSNFLIFGTSCLRDLDFYMVYTSSLSSLHRTDLFSFVTPVVTSSSYLLSLLLYPHIMEYLVTPSHLLYVRLNWTKINYHLTFPYSHLRLVNPSIMSLGALSTIIEPAPKMVTSTTHQPRSI